MNAGTPAESAVVPAVGTAGSLGAVRSLGRNGVHTIAVSERERPPSFVSQYCDEVQPVPSPFEDLPGYRDALLALARREDVGTIVPVREPDVSVLATHRDAFAEHVGTLWPDATTVATVHDRLQLFEAAERAEVAVPETVRLDAVEEWDCERIVKGRHALLTADVADAVPEGQCAFPPKTRFLEPGVEPDVDALIDEMGHVPIAQSYLDGTEFCFRALCRHGDPVATSQKKLRRGYKYARGPSVYHEAVDLPDLEAAGLAMLRELDWHGFASVGFIRDSTGTFTLLEINPRLPASLPVDIHAGVAYPYYFWRVATGLSMPERTAYRPGTASHLLRGEVVHLHSVLSEDYPLAERPSATATALQIATSLCTQPRFDYLSRDDPRPFVRDTLNTARALLPGL